MHGVINLYSIKQENVQIVDVSIKLREGESYENAIVISTSTGETILDYKVDSCRPEV